MSDMEEFEKVIIGLFHYSKFRYIPSDIKADIIDNVFFIMHVDRKHISNLGKMMMTQTTKHRIAENTVDTRLEYGENLYDILKDKHSTISVRRNVIDRLKAKYLYYKPKHSNIEDKDENCWHISPK